jgi:acyl-coenzyme A thioesterase PaaI-like protein
MLEAIGSFRCRPDDHHLVGFTVSSRKLNGRGMLHAGVIPTIADVAIGHALAGMTDPPTALVTVSLACTYIGTAEVDEWVDGVVTPTRIGRRLSAGTAVFSTTRAIATVTALFMPPTQ